MCSSNNRTTFKVRDFCRRGSEKAFTLHYIKPERKKTWNISTLRNFFFLHLLSLGSERFLWEIYVDTFVGFGWRCSSVDQWSINVLLLAVHRFIFFRLTHRCDGKLCVCIYLNILFFGPESKYSSICVTKESIVLDSQSIDVCVAMIRFDWLIWLMAIFIIRWNTLTK